MEQRIASHLERREHDGESITFLSHRGVGRRTFLATIGAATAQPGWTAPQQVTPTKKHCVVLSRDEAERMKSVLLGNAEFQKDRDGLRAAAEKARAAGPWSVTAERPVGLGVNAGPNDYFSEGPYWWPDPKNPRGPYIRKDGEVNSGRFDANGKAMGEMSSASLALGSGALLLGEKAYGERLSQVLRVWFVDPKTRMNPHLEFGQAVRGHNTGRGIGIIDTVSLIYCAAGVGMGEASGLLDRSVAEGVRAWYRDYLRWMTTSAKGLDEKKTTNNHATWWAAQVAAYALLTEDRAGMETACRLYKEQLLPGQVKADGSCPHEEARTRSLSYSAMNLDGFALLCRVAELGGEDLWRYQTKDGITIERAFRYLLPYVLSPGEWKKPQITRFDPGRVVFAGIGGLGLRSEELLTGYRRLPRSMDGSVWVRLVDVLVRSSRGPA